MTWSTLRRTIGLTELLVPFYAAVIIRQFFWLLDSNGAAWILTILVTLLLWVFWLKAKGPNEKPAPGFWLFFAVPLLLVYLLRLPFPDISFDVLNYRLVQSERSLIGPLFIKGDFFPTIFPLNPAVDTLTGIFRHALGYRLGTIINYLALVWTGLVIDRMMARQLSNTVARALLILLVLSTEHILFQITGYMVDLLAIPLLLEATYLAIKYRDSKRPSFDLILISVLLGTSLAIKLSNAPAVIPIGLLAAFQFLKNAKPARKTFLIGGIALVLFLIPALPHAVYIYSQTGSPFFPLYNKFLRSPFWSEINLGDGRWGPRGWGETIIWPLVSIANPTRLSELAVYSGRLSFGFVAAIVCLIWPRTSITRCLAIIFLISSVLWSLTSGYIRYALYIEVIGGILIIEVIIAVFRERAWSQILRWAAILPAALALATQCLLSAAYVQRTEWGGRPTFFTEPNAYFSELKFLLHDRDLPNFIPEGQKGIFDQVETWIVSNVKTSGVEVLLRNRIPMIGIHNQEYFDVKRSRERFRQAVQENSGRNLYSLSLVDDLDASLAIIKQRGFQPGSITRLRIPYYSERIQLPMAMIQVVDTTTPPKPAGEIQITATTAPLPDDACSAEITAQAPEGLSPGQKLSLSASVKNSSTYVWPSRGDKNGMYFINIGDAWLDENGNLVNNLDGRTNLPHDLWPGEMVSLTINVTAPAKPGNYVLELDLVQEGVTWFKAKGSQTLRLPVRVR